MASKKQKRKDFHHIGTPEFMDVNYNSDNMEYIIEFLANGSNTHHLGEHVQTGDEIYLGITEEQAEQLCEQLIGAISNRLKQKLERYNLQKKIYWLSELNGDEKDWDKSSWNSFNNENE